MNGKILTISDKVHGLIELTTLEKEIISSSLFNRLHDVYQNSTVYLTFPSNRTKRFEHSIGVMHLAGEMFFNSVYNASVFDDKAVYEEFIKKAGEEIQKVYESVKKDAVTLISDKMSMGRKKFEQFIIFIKVNGKDADNHMSKRILMFAQSGEMRQVVFGILYQAVRIAALLHDVGHPPYSHITERALKKVYDYCKEDENKNGNKNEEISKFIEIYEKARGEENAQLHEAMGNKMVHRIFVKIIENYISGKCDNYEQKVLYVSTIWGCVNLILSEGTKISKDGKSLSTDCNFWADIHTLISGDLDCDRLDYVVRDNISSMYPADQINYSRLISGMRIEKSGDRFVFAYVAKVIDTLNEFFVKRNSLYENIIFHHRVQKTDKLLIQIIVGLAKDYFNNNKSNSDEEDEAEDRFPFDISGLWKAFDGVDISVDCENRLLRWDDSWLITVLKIELRKRENTPDEYKSNKKIIPKLKEILQNEKNYFSAVKRGYDFEIIDESFTEEMSDLLGSLKPDGNAQDGFTENVRSFIKFIANGRHIDFKGFESKIFALQFFHNFLYKDVFDGADDFEKAITDCVVAAKDEYNRDHSENKIEDVLVGVKRTKSAKNDIQLYRPYQGHTLFPYVKESNIVNIIDLFKYDMPLFYIYIKKCDPKSAPINMEELLGAVGKKIAMNFYLRIDKKLKK